MGKHDKIHAKMHEDKGLSVVDIDTMSSAAGTDFRSQDIAIRDELGNQSYKNYWLGHGWLTRTDEGHLIYTAAKSWR